MRSAILRKVRILLSAPGVEDSRSPAWGHVRASLLHLGHEVFSYDPVETARLVVRGTVDDQRRWVLAEFQPHRVLLIPSGEKLDAPLRADAAERGLIVVDLDIEELSASRAPGEEQLLPACGPLFPGEPLPYPRDDARRPDAVLIGSHAPRRERTARALVEAGTNLLLLGDGWGEAPGLRRFAKGPATYPHRADQLRRTRVAIVLPEPPRDALSVGPLHATLEALACGLPVVTTDPAIAQRLGDPPMVETVSEDELSDRVAALLEDPSIGPANGARAIDRIDTHHRWSDRWEELLRGGPSTSVRARTRGPAVTVFMGAYNIEEHIGDAIESVLSQTDPDFELLVTTDGSTDGSESVVRRYLGDQRVRLFTNSNVGQTGRFDYIWRNLMPHARGEYLAKLDGDDVATPDRLERQLAVLRNEPEVDLVHGAGIVIDGAGRPGAPTFELDTSYDSSSELRRLIKGNNIAFPTVLMRREAFERCGEWSGGFAGDYERWIRMARVGRFRYLARPLVHYRVHEKSSSMTVTGEQNAASVDQGLLIRLAERERSGAVDLYPALEEIDETDAMAWAAAYVDIGNGHLRYLPAPEAALREYDRALTLVGPLPQLHRNRAVALALAGDLGASSNALAQSDIVGADPSALTIHQLVPGPALSPVPFVLPLERARQALCWDGTPASRTRVLVVPNWNDLPSLQLAIQTYALRFSAKDDIDLAITTNGIPADDAMQLVLSAIPAGIDLADAAELTLEEWDHLGYLPMERFATTIDLRFGFDADGLARTQEAMLRLASMVPPRPQ